MEQKQSQEKKFVLHTRVPEKKEKTLLKNTRQPYVYDSNYKEEIPYDLWIAGKACISFCTNPKSNRQNIVDAVNLIHTLMIDQNAEYTMTEKILNFKDATVMNYSFMASGDNSIGSILQKSFETIISKEKKETINNDFESVVVDVDKLSENELLEIAQQDQNIINEATTYLQEQKTQGARTEAFKKTELYKSILQQAYANANANAKGKKDDNIERNAVNSYWNEILKQKKIELAKQKMISDGKEAALKSINDDMSLVATFSLEQVEVRNRDTNQKETQEKLKVNLSGNTLAMINVVVEMLNKINVELLYHSVSLIHTLKTKSQQSQEKTPVKLDKNSKNQKKLNKALNQFTTPVKNEAKRTKSANKSPKKKVTINEQPQDDNVEFLSPSKQRSSSVVITPKSVLKNSAPESEINTMVNDGGWVSRADLIQFNSAFDSLKKENDNLNKQIAELKEENIKLQEQLKKSLESRQVLSNNYINFQTSVKEDLEKIGELEKTIRDLQTQVDEKPNELTQKETEIADLKKSVEEQNNNLTELQDKISKLQEQISTDKETNEKLTSTNTELQAQLESVKQESIGKENELAQLKIKIQEEGTRQQNLQENVADLTKKLQTQQETETANQNLKTLLADKETKIDQLTNKLNDISSQKEAAAKELEEVKKQIADLQKNAAATTNEQIIRNLQAELTAKKSVMKEMEDNLNQFSNNIANLNKENENLKKEIEQRNSENGSLNLTNNELQRKLNELTKNVEKTQEKNRTFESQVTEKIEELTKTNKELAEQNATEKESVTKITVENTALKNELEENKESIKAKNQKINELEESNRSLSTKNTELTSTLEKNNEKFNQTKKANQTLIAKVNGLEESLTNIRQESENALKKANEENAALEKSINEQKGQIQKLEAELQTKAQLENENNQLKEQVESLTQAQNEKESQTQNLTLETKLSLSQAVVPAFSFDQQNVSLSTEVIPQEEPKSEVKLAECLYGFASCCLGAALVVAACVPVVRELVGLAAFGIILAKAIGGAFLGVGVFAMGFSFRDKIKNAPARAAIANAEYQRLNQPVTNQPTLA